MATLIDLLRQLGQHAAPDGRNALVGPVVLPGVSDSPLTLGQPAGSQLVAAWSRQVQRVTLGHHALALSAAQTNYSVALMGHGSAPHDDLLLLLLTQLQRQPRHVGLCIVPHEQSVFSAKLTALADTIGLSWLDATQPGARIRPASLVLTTASELHRRILHFHDRSWRWLWPRLQLLALPELHRASGVSAGHLHWVLRRVARLRPDQRQSAPLQVLSSLAPVADAEATLLRLLPEDTHYPLRVVAAPDGPAHNTLVALWRCGGDRLTPMARLVEQLRARRVPVAVLGRDATETQQLRAALAAAGTDASTEQARVAIVSGVPPTSAARQALMRAGYRLLLLLAGDEPHELLYATQPELLLHTLPSWPLALSNPYISAAQLVCAAAERPIEEAEIDRWHLRDLRDRLLKKGSLQPLPGLDLWQSTPEAGDPYAKLDLRTVGAPPAALLAPDGAPLGLIAPALLDRRALPGQMFAPGLRVAERDQQAGTVQLVADTSGADTIVLAEVTAAVREEQAARTLHFGKTTAELIKGKVLATQQVVGLRELRPDGTERRLPVAPAGETQWSAAACWIDLPPASTQPSESNPRASLPFQPADPHTLGWSFAQVVPLITLAPPGALVVAYAAQQQRLYLIEAEPGGVGLISAVYEQFERLIELAARLTAACAGRPLYARVAACETAWLRLLNPAVLQPKPAAAPAPKPATATTPEPAPRPATTPEPAPRPASRPATTPAPRPASRPVAAATPRPPAQPAARPSNILPFPTRRPALDRDETGSVERSSASIGESPSTSTRVEQEEATSVRARIYAGQRSIPPIQMPSAAMPNQQDFESPAAPVDPLPSAIQAASPTESTPPSVRQAEPMLPAVAQPQAEPAEAASATARADTSTLAAAESAPSALHHAAIYPTPVTPDAADDQARTIDAEQAVTLPIESDDTPRSITEHVAPGSEASIPTADPDLNEPVAPADDIALDEPPVVAVAGAADQLPVALADVALDDEPDTIDHYVALVKEPEGVPGDLLTDDEAAAPADDIALDHEPPAPADDVEAADEPPVVAVAVAADELPVAIADVALDDAAPSIALDGEVGSGVSLVAPQPKAEHEMTALPSAPEQPPRVADVDPDDDLPPLVPEEANQPGAVAAVDEPVTVAAVEPQERLPRGRRAATYDVPPTVVEILAADDMPDVAVRRRRPDQTESKPVEVAAAGPSDPPGAADVAHTEAQPDQPERPTVRPRRWQPAASAQFRIDDLLPPLPSDEQEDQADQVEVDPSESSATAGTATPGRNSSEPDAAPHLSSHERDVPPDTRPRRELRETSPARRFTERDDAAPHRGESSRREQPASRRERSRQEQPERSRQEQPGSAPSRYDRGGQPGPQRTTPQREQRGYPQSNREQPYASQTPREPRSDPQPNREPRGNPSRSSGTPQRRDSQPSTPRGRTPDSGARQPSTPGRAADAGRPSTPPREPARPAPRQPAPEPQQPADVGAMIDRMRRLRQQRESEQQATNQRGRPSASRGAAPHESADEMVELRFHIGDRVQCLPYGVGRVRASRIIDGRELVQIDFPDYGEIEVDPSISLVRQLEQRPNEASERETPDSPDD